MKNPQTGALLAAWVAAVWLATTVAAETTSVPTDFSVWGYLPEYRLGGFNYEAAFQTGMTHLIFFSLEIDVKTGLPSAKDRLPSKEAAAEARKAADKVGGKVILSFGGNARSQGFPTAAQTKQTRTKFLVALNKILKDYDFDGVDYNWEYPRNEVEWRQWSDLLRESKQYLLNPKADEYWDMVAKQKAEEKAGGPKTGIDASPTAAVRQQMWKEFFVKTNDENYKRNVVTFTMYLDPNHYDVINKFNLLKDADMVHCMAYDQPGAHSTMEFAKRAITIAKQKKFNLKKFTLGVPFYGRHIDNGEPITWYDLVEKLEAQGAPETTDNYERFYFNNHWTIREKTKLSVDAKIGGIMIWEIGQDKQPMSNSNSLMSAIFEVTSKLPQTPALSSSSSSSSSGTSTKDEL